MNRRSFVWTKQVEHPTERVGKVVLFDYDGIVHTCLYQGLNEETGELNPEYTESDLEFLSNKLNEMTLKVLNAIEEKYDIVNLYCFVAGKNNFRKIIYPEYKANRKERHPLLYKMYECAKVAFNTISSDGAEADDYLYTFAKKTNFSSIIVTVDSDLACIPGLHYNYRKELWTEISKTEGIYNMYKKLAVNDPGDNVKLTQGCGIKWFEKNFHIDMNTEEYENALFNTYLKVWKEEGLAREKMELAKKLLKLHDVEGEDFKNLIQVPETV